MDRDLYMAQDYEADFQVSLAEPQLHHFALYVVTIRDRVDNETVADSRADSYMIGLTLLGSIILYPMKNMAYIDALFFAAGAATQSGLNT